MQKTKKKIKILFLCTGNSCRSRMAEGWAKNLRADSIEAYSAGIEPRRLDAIAVRVMAEAGVDISAGRSKHLDELMGIEFDYVVTVCDNANEHCPVFAGKTKVVHIGFDDPPGLAKDVESEEQILKIYRRVRDEIKSFIEKLPDYLKYQRCNMSDHHTLEQNEKNRKTVRDGYSEIARDSKSCCGCSNPKQFAEAIGYSTEELDSLPEGANMGLSCGNPTAIAALKSGQVVLDLGSGGGFDVFIAAKKVGPQGKTIGVDMTPEMLGKARAGISRFTEETGLSNVEFRLGEIEHLPVEDAGVDVVISNCVINLSPDKTQVWNEIARVLKPGGKACISDLALKKPLPEEILKSAAALVSCVAGVVLNR